MILKQFDKHPLLQWPHRAWAVPQSLLLVPSRPGVRRRAHFAASADLRHRRRGEHGSGDLDDADRARCRRCSSPRWSRPAGGVLLYPRGIHRTLALLTLLYVLRRDRTLDRRVPDTLRHRRRAFDQRAIPSAVRPRPAAAVTDRLRERPRHHLAVPRQSAPDRRRPYTHRHGTGIPRAHDDRAVGAERQMLTSRDFALDRDPAVHRHPQPHTAQRGQIDAHRMRVDRRRARRSWCLRRGGRGWRSGRR